jgi:hypothetical protein
MSLKQMVQKGNTVTFLKYYDGDLWYRLVHANGETLGSTDIPAVEVFDFPVPVSDIGNATFHATDKAILFMRYIRKQLKLESEGVR